MSDLFCHRPISQDPVDIHASQSIEFTLEYKPSLSSPLHYSHKRVYGGCICAAAGARDPRSTNLQSACVVASRNRRLLKPTLWLKPPQGLR
ncbi:jg23331 [Pararge aegeria aegeria]|uniref:Jg23331 protein n=1 Tax=Pararge aegeria aegeria TaxID=348720 RepID=A0A8S4QKC5_9NEOP|nr:jg23331 [Pararge aegeria aegeria]